jgi:hypothetical protein
MIDTDLRSPSLQGYVEPDFHELLDLAQSYGAVIGCEFTAAGVSIRMPHRHYEVTLAEGRMLIEGVLTGLLLAEANTSGEVAVDAAWRS